MEEVEKINTLPVRQKKTKRDIENTYMDTTWGRVGRMSWEMELTHIYH